MDRENLVQIKTLIDKILPGERPSDEALDFDMDTIVMYDALENLRDAMENCGF